MLFFLSDFPLGRVRAPGRCRPSPGPRPPPRPHRPRRRSLPPNPRLPDPCSIFFARTAAPAVRFRSPSNRRSTTGTPTF